MARSRAAAFAIFSSADGSNESGLNLGAMGGGVGKYKAIAKPERDAGGFQGVAARRNVVHEIGFLERQGSAGACQVVLVGRDGAKRQFVAGALGLNGLGAVDGFDNLGAGAMHGDHAGNGISPLRSGDGTSRASNPAKKF
jgi:hypothetical protein